MQTPQTQWSVVARAAKGPPSERLQAMDQLLRTYLPVLRQGLISGYGATPKEAEEYAQAFAAERILEHEILRHADPARGRFRTFLLTAFRNYVRSCMRRERRRGLPRGPAHSDGEIGDHAADDVRPAVWPGQTMDIEWARHVLAECLNRTRDHLLATDRETTWKLFQARLIEPLMHHRDPPPYKALMVDLGFESALQASNALLSAKRTFRNVLREVVSETVLDETDIQEEIDDLLEILAHPHARSLL